jgi:3-hydroxy-9,10-secoandrosta-1,3,5(10)-triene-9,17-dione monooxygenase reductase component
VADDVADDLAGAEAEAARQRAVDANRMREAMGMFATGVTVITTRGPDGRPFGTTANAVSSVSLRPPLVLACLREESETLSALLVRRKFAINVLHSSQTELSDRFARPAADDTWDAVAHRTVEEIPILEGAIATLRCDLHDIADGGDHSVVVGHVTDLAQSGSADAEPLLYYAGTYHSLGAPQVPRARWAGRAGHQSTEIALPSRLGPLRALSLSDDEEQTSVAVLIGEPRDRPGVLVYAHCPCVLGDALGSTACAGRARLDQALEQMRGEGCGVAVYHRDPDAPFGACCATGGGHDVPALSPGAIDALAQAVRTLRLGAVRLIATEPDARAAARAGVPIGELVDPRRP